MLGVEPATDLPGPVETPAFLRNPSSSLAIQRFSASVSYGRSRSGGMMQHGDPTSERRPTVHQFLRQECTSGN